MIMSGLEMNVVLFYCTLSLNSGLENEFMHRRYDIATS